MTKILPELADLATRIDELFADPDNARRHPERNIAALCESLSRFGQLKPVVAVRGSGLVVSGNARLEAARRLGWDHLAAVWFDDEEEARAYAVVDNRTAELAEWHGARLVGALDELEPAGFAPAALGFEPAEVERARRKAATGQPVDAEINDPPAHQYRCPRCGHEWDDEADR